MDDRLLAYLQRRDEQRAEAVDRMLGSLTERERALVKEAAVMGYVQGYRVPDSAKDRGSYPKDEAVLRLCLDASRAFRDLYPNLAALDGEGP